MITVSRGIGRLQREVLGVVERNAAGGPSLPPGKVASMPTGEIMARLGGKPQLRSVQRALAGLSARGLLVSRDGDRDRWGCFGEVTWTTPEEYDRAVTGAYVVPEDQRPKP